MFLVEWGIGGFFLGAVLVWFIINRIKKNNPDYSAVVLTLLIAGLFDHWLLSGFVGVTFWWVVLALGLRPMPSMPELDSKV